MIKVRDVAYIRFSTPDIDAMEKFGTDFGFTVTAREGDTLYMRGTDPSPYCHVSTLGEPGFLGVAFEAASAEDLQKASELEGASAVESLVGPGGGHVVRFSDPDGIPVEIVHGRELLPKIDAPAALPYNTGGVVQRLGQAQRVPSGPSKVKRIGHAVLKTKDYRISEAWYKSRFGFLTSDEIYLGEKDNVITAFLRCDRGQEHVDHHTLLCIGLGEVGFDHAAFEVEDFDALMAGHDALKAAGYTHVAGIGRHILGAHVFDYWKDPWGNTLEHFTDGDLFNADHPMGVHDPGVALGTQWGTAPVPS